MDGARISLTFPDGNSRDYPAGITAADVAADISKSLGKAALAARVDGTLTDLSRPIDADAALEIVTAKDDAALELIRHDCAHIMARAVQELWPDVKVTIGPVIENGFYYDFDRDEPFSSDDLEAIEKKMREIIALRDDVRTEVWDRDRAVAYYEAQNEPFKVELVGMIPEGEPIRMYWHGNWQDLCRGPHLAHTGQVPADAFKLMSVAGAYWRGDSDNKMLQRIYGVAFRTKQDLKDHLHMIEEAQKRDHRKLGREMELFHLQEEAPGMVFWHPNGWTLYRVMEDYMRRKLTRAGYKEIKTPQVVDRKLWEASGHWEAYQENMFIVEVDEEHAKEKRINALKPMNCPCHVQVYNQGLKSYRDLPLRLAEFGSCHRYESSGSMHGLMRVRGFTQDDAHIFCTESADRKRMRRLHRPAQRHLPRRRVLGFRHQALDAARETHRQGRDLGHGRKRAGKRHPVGPQRFRDRPRRRRLLRPQARLQAHRRHWARMAVRHLPGRLPVARPAGRGVCRRGRGQAPPRHAPPRHPRVVRALHRYPDRKLRGQVPPVAGPTPDRRRLHRLGRGRLRPRSWIRSRPQACAPRPIPATKRSTTRSASTRSARSP